MTSTDTDQKFQKALSTLWQADLYKHVPLAAIVVCGDQSSGKSAVLEAISGFRFPTNDGMCTRFVTMVEMEQDDLVGLTATINPSPHHSPYRQEELRQWKYNTLDLTEFDQVVLRAGQVIGSGLLKGFLKDELVIRISGPKLSAFVFIDIPGIIQSTREDQPDSDIDYIKDLVTKYMKDPTKIVLTVVAANNDLELQGVLRQAKQIDPFGKRTIGVITKPDACEDRPSVQQAALKLLENTGNGLYQWLLGWHIVKNRSESQRDWTTAQRDDAERAYLAQAPWDQVPDQFKGADNLSSRLQVEVDKLFNSGLPKLKTRINEMLQDTVIELDWLSPNASNFSSPQMKLGAYLDEISKEMNGRIERAGQDTRDEFGSSLEDAAADLVNAIRLHGHFYDFDESCLVEQPRPATAEVQAEWDLSEPRPVHELQTFAEGVVTELGADAGQLTDETHKKLFRKQIEHWPCILHQYIDTIKDLLETQLSEASSQIVPKEIETTFNDVLIAKQVESFAEKVRAHTTGLLIPGKLRGKQVTEATSKAWKAQHHKYEEQRLKEAFGVPDNSTSAKGQNPKREYQTVLKALKQLDVDVGGFPARQAIGMMQLLYIGRTDDVKPLCDEKAMLKAMRDFFAGWSERVVRSTTDEQLKIVFNATTTEDEEVIRLKAKIDLYKECLVLLNDLPK